MNPILKLVIIYGLGSDRIGDCTGLRAMSLRKSYSHNTFANAYDIE
jgi:hypothetical protein